MVFFMPNFMGHADNYIPANSLQTPAHIVPEWYFLPFYAILRSITFSLFGIPAKLLGVVAMFGAIAVLFVLPWLDTSRVRSIRFRPVYRWFFWLLVVSVIALGYAGSQPPEGPAVLIGQVGMVYYFLFFLVITPILGKIERPLPLPRSISESVLGPSAAPNTVKA
jgi:ubiquinol-cytochrome c reductase cytochrome b subunit